MFPYKSDLPWIYMYSSLYLKIRLLQENVRSGYALDQSHKIATDCSEQTVLILKEQSDHSFHCLPFHLHVLEPLLHCKATYHLSFVIRQSIFPSETIPNI